MNKCYYRIVWENYPSDKTPLNEQNLNKIDVATDEIDNRIISIDSTKFDKAEAQLLVKYIEYDEDTGIFKITHYNGASYTIDTLLEKLAINFDYDYQTQKLIIELSDGEVKYVDLSALITQYEFLESETIHFLISPNGEVTADIKEGSIQEKHLRPDYLADIKVEVAKAEASANDADESAKEAATSAAAAKSSEDAAKVSETAAAQSAKDAEDSANSSLEKAKEAADSAAAAKASEDNAKASEDAAAKSAEEAAKSEENAENSAVSAGESASKSEQKAGEAGDYANLSKSYAVGTDGEVRPNDPTDNSKYYSDLAQYLTDEAAKLLDQAQKLISAATAGALIPSGTVAFENLPSEPKIGSMYNISNSFVTDERFAEGPGIQYNPGANVYWTADGQWDVMIGVQVTGVKGAAESFYRQGNVNITPANIGLGNVPNVATNDQTPGFTQAATRENIESGEKLSTLFGKIKKWFADLKVVAFSGNYSDLSGTPTALKNPSALTFTGGVTGSYDGSAEKSVAIPAAATAAPKVAGTATVGTGTTWARADHVHPAQTTVSGSSGSCTGNAATATALTTTSAGSATKPVYFSGGKPVACTYTLGKSVPANAVFTDTTDAGFSAVKFGQLGYLIYFYGTCKYFKVGNCYRVYVEAMIGNEFPSQTSMFTWGFNLNFIKTTLSIPSDAAYVSGTYEVYRDGMLLMGEVGYATMFGINTQTGISILVPGRFYDANGHIGEWPVSQFKIGDRFYCTIDLIA